MVVLVLDVLFDHRQRCSACRGDKVAVRPECWQTGFYARKLLAQYPGSLPLDLLDQAMDAVLRGYLNKEMHMVGHYLQFDYFGLVLRSFQIDQFF